jgi:putative ABC transport system substrate-binding protein
MRMRRRDLMILGIAGAAAAIPLALRAQQKAMPVVGYLSVGSLESDDIPERLVAFRRGLEEAGYIEGRNVAIEYAWAAGEYARLAALAADLVRRQVTVIVAQNAPTAFAAKSATSTIPIVFDLGIDPVRSGFVASLNRPGGNITGVSILGAELMGKRLEFLRELLPASTIVGFLANPGNPNIESETKSLQDAARSLGLELRIVQASTPSEIEAAFETLVGLRAGALAVSTDTFFTSHRDQIIALATRHAVPTIYAWRLFPAAGGLMSYGTDIADSYRQLGQYTAKILKGAKPAELPVQQVVRIELVINLKTAKALGLTVPRSVLARADEVIE